MPVRTPSNRGGNTIGWFASYKMHRSIGYERLLECDYLYLLDFADDVVGFEEQPLTITYQHAGRTHRYTPDVRVSQGGHELLMECKPLALVPGTWAASSVGSPGRNSSGYGKIARRVRAIHEPGRRATRSAERRRSHAEAHYPRRDRRLP